MKKIITLLLAIVFGFSSGQVFAEDISTWAEEGIEQVKELDVFDSKVFSRYQDHITREEFIYLAVTVYESLSLEEISDYDTISFSDTDDIYAKKAAKVGITSGIGNGMFGPNDKLTREQLAVFMVKALRLSGVDITEGNHTFIDEDSFSPWAVSYIKEAKANGVISGNSKNAFNAQGYASREVALIIMNNILSNHLKETEVIHPELDMDYTSEQLEVCYDLTIDDFSSGYIDVVMTIINNTSPKVDLREYGMQHGPQGKIEDIKAYDVNGDALTISDEGIWYRGWGTTGKQYSVETQGINKLSVHYRVYKQVNMSSHSGYTSYEGYLGKDYGVFTGEQAIGLFMFNNGQVYINENIHLSIDVGPGYAVVTPWYEEDGIYYPNENFYSQYHLSHGVRKEDNFLLSTFAVGKLRIIEQQTGETNTSVAVPASFDELKQKQVAENIFVLIEYYNALFGSSVLDQYLMVYLPTIDGVDSIWAGESVSSQGTNIRGEDYNLDMIGHQMFHRWNAFVLGWEVNDLDVRSFFKEGSNRYFEGKAIVENYHLLNYLGKDEIHYLENIYNTYIEKYDRGEIIPLQDARDGDVNENLAWNAYQTGALVWFALDMKLYQDNDGAYTVNHIMKDLDKASRQNGQEITYNVLKTLLISNTGQDYGAFLDQYIYDNKALDLGWCFQDPDGDHIPTYVEIIRGTNPNSGDFDIDITDLFAISIYGVDVSNTEFHSVGSRDGCDYINDLFQNKVQISKAFGYKNWTKQLNEFRGENTGYFVNAAEGYDSLPGELNDYINKNEFDALISGGHIYVKLDDGAHIFIVKE